MPLRNVQNKKARARNGQSGFTMIELLTVIAIIAILAAIVFPVAGTVRARAQQNQVISNLKSLQAALGIYKLDEHGYPASLGPVAYVDNGARVTYAGLYPEWVRGRDNYDSPALDLPQTDVEVPVAANVAVTNGVISGSLPGTLKDPIRFPNARMNAWNTMDGHVATYGADDNPDQWRYIPHYSRFRTLDRNDKDYKRQLFYRNPPEDTVVTWNDTFVQKNLDTDAYERGTLLVLFLNGTVKKYDVAKLPNDLKGEYWRLKP